MATDATLKLILQDDKRPEPRPGERTTPLPDRALLGPAFLPQAPKSNAAPDKRAEQAQARPDAPVPVPPIASAAPPDETREALQPVVEAVRQTTHTQTELARTVERVAVEGGESPPITAPSTEKQLPLAPASQSPTPGTAEPDQAMIRPVADQIGQLTAALKDGLLTDEPKKIVPVVDEVTVPVEQPDAVSVDTVEPQPLHGQMFGPEALTIEQPPTIKPEVEQAGTIYPEVKPVVTDAEITQPKLDLKAVERQLLETATAVQAQARIKVEDHAQTGSVTSLEADLKLTDAADRLLAAVESVQAGIAPDEKALTDSALTVQQVTRNEVEKGSPQSLETALKLADAADRIMAAFDVVHDAVKRDGAGTSASTSPSVIGPATTISPVIPPAATIGPASQPAAAPAITGTSAPGAVDKSGPPVTPAAQPAAAAPPDFPGQYFVEKIGREYGVFKKLSPTGSQSEGVDVFSKREDAETLVYKLDPSSAPPPAAIATPAAVSPATTTTPLESVSVSSRKEEDTPPILSYSKPTATTTGEPKSDSPVPQKAQPSGTPTVAAAASPRDVGPAATQKAPEAATAAVDVPDVGPASLDAAVETPQVEMARQKLNEVLDEAMSAQKAATSVGRVLAKTAQAMPEGDAKEDVRAALLVVQEAGSRAKAIIQRVRSAQTSLPDLDEAGIAETVQGAEGALQRLQAVQQSLVTPAHAASGLGGQMPPERQAAAAKKVQTDLARIAQDIAAVEESLKPSAAIEETLQKKAAENAEAATQIRPVESPDVGPVVVAEPLDTAPVIDTPRPSDVGMVAAPAAEAVAVAEATTQPDQLPAGVLTASDAPHSENVGPIQSPTLAPVTTPAVQEPVNQPGLTPTAVPAPVDRVDADTAPPVTPQIPGQVQPSTETVKATAPAPLQPVTLPAIDPAMMPVVTGAPRRARRPSDLLGRERAAVVDESVEQPVSDLLGKPARQQSHDLTTAPVPTPEIGPIDPGFDDLLNMPLDELAADAAGSQTWQQAPPARPAGSLDAVDDVQAALEAEADRALGMVGNQPVSTQQPTRQQPIVPTPVTLPDIGPIDPVLHGRRRAVGPDRATVVTNAASDITPSPFGPVTDAARRADLEAAARVEVLPDISPTRPTTPTSANEVGPVTDDVDADLNALFNEANKTLQERDITGWEDDLFAEAAKTLQQPVGPVAVQDTTAAKPDPATEQHPKSEHLAHDVVTLGGIEGVVNSAMQLLGGGADGAMGGAASARGGADDAIPVDIVRSIPLQIEGAGQVGPAAERLAETETEAKAAAGTTAAATTVGPAIELKEGETPIPVEPIAELSDADEVDPAKMARAAADKETQSLERQKAEEQLSKDVDQERRKIDPAYRKKVEGQEEEKEAKKLYDRLGKQGGTAGITNPKKSAEGGFEIKPGQADKEGASGAGVLVGAATMLKSAAEGLGSAFTTTIGVVNQFGGVMASINADGFGKELNNLARQLPAVGSIIGSFGDALSSVIGGLDATSRRLASYNPELAAQQAINEVRDIHREISRAQRMGPMLANYADARQNVKERLEDVLEKLTAKLVPLVTTILDHMATGIEYISPLTDLIGMVIQEVNVFYVSWSEWISREEARDRVNRGINERIERNTRRDWEPQTGINMLEQMRQSLNNIANLRPNQPRPNQQPLNIPGLNF